MSLALQPGQSLQSLRQAGSLVRSLSPRQRLTLIAVAAAVVVGIGWMVYGLNAAPYTTLYSSLDAADAQAMAAQLARLAIPYQTSPDGAAISVPGNDVDKARLAMATAGLPHSGQMGFEVFDKTNWSGSDFDEQVNYQRAMEGELERTIETIHDVQSARVHVTLAHDSLFTADDRGAKAAVLLTLRDGHLDPAMVTAIQHLVASAVDKLSPRDVSVMDASGDLALSGQAQDQAGLEGQLQAKIVATLAPIVGAGHVRASVNVAYDPTSSDDTQETYDPKGSVVLSSQSNRAGAAAATVPAGVPGTSSNLPAVQAPGTSLKSELGLGSPGGEQSDSETYAVSRSVDHVVRPADTIQRVTAAVIVDNAVSTVTSKGHAQTVNTPRSAQEMQQLQALAAAAIGLNPARGDVLTVTNLPFAAEAAPVAAAPRPAPVANPPWAQWLRWAALGLCALILAAFALGRGLRPKRRAAAPEPAPAQLHAAAAPAMAASHANDVLAAPANAAAAEAVHDVLNITELLSANPEGTPPEVRQVLQLKTRVAERVKREPAIASRLVQGWMNKQHEEGV